MASACQCIGSLRGVASTAAENPRRAQIIGVAADLFDRDGYHETSMQAIAERTGIRKASLYHYFRSKDELLVELHETLMTVVIGRHLDRRTAERLGPRDELRAMMRDVIGLMDSHPGYLRIFFESYRELPPVARSSVAAQRSRYRQLVADVITAGNELGEFRGVDPDLTSLAVLSLMNWTYQWFGRSGPLTTDEVADHFWSLLLNGIGTAPDR
ncbi:TetR family transcriptional regulator [Blastococcus xanthinilyticus]|uniref:TetR family transcriptional regulator n=1 Tax=Blastococcus xanthinilyticus TaxID=1564164 RepID=A0A5S5CRF7_9ACTN|nr:TetR family transcriptional regulator [Blastococcus xanthinilyticus]